MTMVSNPSYEVARNRLMPSEIIVAVVGFDRPRYCYLACRYCSLGG